MFEEARRFTQTHPRSLWEGPCGSVVPQASIGQSSHRSPAPEAGPPEARTTHPGLATQLSGDRESRASAEARRAVGSLHSR